MVMAFFGIIVLFTLYSCLLITRLPYLYLTRVIYTFKDLVHCASCDEYLMRGENKNRS